MQRYISLINFTDQGATNMKDSPNRAHAFTAAAETAGIRVIAQYWTVGSYDGVLIIEAEDGNRAVHYLAELVADGNVRTNTLQAFTDTEIENILA